MNLTSKTRFRQVGSPTVFSFFKMAPHNHVTLANLTNGGLMRVSVRYLLDATKFETFEA